MIITRSPLRISLGGGGTDLPSYYSRFGGFLIAAAIDKYVYINIHKTFQPEYLIKYSRFEKVKNILEIEHPIIREALVSNNFQDLFVEISSMADIPAGTGLGSSGSFTTALIKALSAYNKQVIEKEALAEAACDIELNKLKEPIGKQDQYIAAFGGINCFEFEKDGKVKVTPLKVSDETIYNLEDHLLLFFTGYSRSASGILKDQNEKSQKDDSAMLENLHFTKELGMKSKVAFETGDLEGFARLMNIHWEHKRKRTAGMSNDHINDWYDYAMKNGALGGKLIGAGGGGFLMFYAEDTKTLRHAMAQKGLREVRFRFDFEGSKVVAS